MRDIEKHIKDNLDSFMTSEPSADHFEKFQKKLNKSRKPKLSIVKYLKVASVAILFSISSVWVYEKATQDNTDTTTELSASAQLYKELMEAESYYHTVVNNKMNQIDTLSPKEENIKAELLEKEFKEFDEVFNELKKDLKSGKNEDIVVQQMIRLYQSKVDFLNKIIGYLEEQKQKTKSYEVKQI